MRRNYYLLVGEQKNELKYRSIVWMMALVVALRMLFIFLMGPMPQDAYYHFYGEHPALSYFDHPPAIAYLLRTFTTVFGKKVFAIKLADSVITACTCLSFYALAKKFLPRPVANQAFVWFLSTFMITVLSLVSTPDVPLLLFWTLSLHAFYTAVIKQKKQAWLLTGFLMGLAFDSKYTAVFLPAGAFLFLLISARHRKQLFTVWPWIAVLIFAVTALPVIVWNMQNNFASFRFQSQQRVESGFSFDITNIFGVLGHQSAILLPILYGAIIFWLFVSLKKGRLRLLSQRTDLLFLWCFFIPIFIGFTFIAVFYWVKLNWMMPAYVTGIIWVSRYINIRWLRIQVIISAIAHILMAIEVLFYPVPILSDDTWFGWKTLADKTVAVQQKVPGSIIFAADDYKTAAELNFFLPQMVYSGNVIGQRALQFDFIGTNLQSLAGKNAIFLDSDPGFDDTLRAKTVPAILQPYFKSITQVDPIIIRNGDKPVRKFFVFVGYQYRPPSSIRH